MVPTTEHIHVAGREPRFRGADWRTVLTNHPSLDGERKSSQSRQAPKGVAVGDKPTVGGGLRVLIHLKLIRI